MLLGNVTAVLITREDEYPRDISFNVHFGEVLVKTNCRTLTDRFEVALQARNEIIYVQDDDAEIDVASLWRHYDGRLTNAMTWGHLQIYNDLCHNHVTLIGWGCFFPKRLIDFTPWTGDARPPSQVEPAHEIDRIFTHLAYRYQEAPHNTVISPFRQITRTRAMSRDNLTHYKSRDEIIRTLEGML